jgi:hypothetical protein
MGLIAAYATLTLGGLCAGEVNGVKRRKSEKSATIEADAVEAIFFEYRFVPNSAPLWQRGVRGDFETVTNPP